MRIGLAMAAVLMFVGTGCATIRGDQQKVKFESDPSGAEVVVDGGAGTAVTPGEVMLKRKMEHKVQVKKEGYKTVAFTLNAQFDGAVLTDLVLPGGSALTGLSVTTGSDKAFNTLKMIKLEKGAGTISLWEHRGVLYDKAGYDAAMKEEVENKERFMGQN